MANGIFSAAEISILSIRKTRLAELVEAGSGSAKAAQALRNKPVRFLATVQIGITVIGATAAAYGGADLARDLTPYLHRWGMPNPHAWAFVIVIAGVSYLSLVLGELIPKSLALRHAEGYGLFIARPVGWLSVLTRPLTWFLTGSSNVILKLFGDSTDFAEAKLSPDELQALVEEASKKGSLDPRIGDIASRAIDFGGLQVVEVMVPRSQIVALSVKSNAAELLRMVSEEGHSRYPVYDGTLDSVVGYVMAKDVIALSAAPELIILQDVLRPVWVVPETRRAIDVLKEMQRRHTQMAVIANEHGSVTGLVTLEDLVEELVGDIFGEKQEASQDIQREAGGTALVVGTTPVREVNRVLGLSLPERDDYSTVAGMCVVHAGWIPPVGAKLRVEDGTELEIVDSSPRRVRLVRLRPAAEKKKEKDE